MNPIMSILSVVLSTLGTATAPTFESEPTSMMVEFKEVVPDETGPEEIPKPQVETRAETQVESSGEGLVDGLVERLVEGLVGDKGSTTQEASVKTSVKTSVIILHTVGENPEITIPQLADITGVTTRSVERNIKKLQDTGKLRRVGPDKGGHWEILEGQP